MKRLILVLCVCLMARPSFGEQNIKHPNVSGQFYPADPKALSSQIESFLTQANIEPSSKPIQMIIAPHAGYDYSGGVAGYSFKAISKQKYKTVVILAPSHFFGFDGISVWKDGAFETPLGLVDVDQDFTSKLIGISPNIYFEPQAFSREHSLEVEIPFLQKSLSGFKIVPIIIGSPRAGVLKDFAHALNSIIGEREDVLIVVSTDLSHYYPYDKAKELDAKAIDAIKRFDVEAIYRGCFDRSIEMCGCMPVTAGLLYAIERGLNKVELLHAANSGDATGEKDRVVGYSSFVLYSDGKKKQAASLSHEQKKRLLDIARQTMEEYVRSKKIVEPKESDLRLSEAEGAFVTIHKKSQLRGCIGNIIGQGPLYLTVRNMAIAAASEDPRFSPVKPGELDQLEIEISVLSKPQQIHDVNNIQMGTHGVILSKDYRSGVFLPQVATETKWSKEEFLSQLCSQKAGLPADCWKDPQTKIEIFTADVFSEKEIK
jgi:AmmeMemoRadiSam system protein B/AmmeMemoRadiSam system protein A